MSPRLAPSPALLVRGAVAVGAIGAFAVAVVGYAGGRFPVDAGFGGSAVLLVLAGAVARRYGIALPGNGFTSYVLGLSAYAILDRGWPFAVLVAPLAIGLGDRFLRHLHLRAALTNAAHLTAGSALVGWLYGRLGGVTGLAALSGENLVPLVALLVLLPVVVNGSFYLELALDRTLAWVDARLTARWEAIVYLASAALALGWFGLAHAGLPTGGVATLAVLLAGMSLGSIYVLRMGVRADELDMVQRLSQALAADINIARSFPRLQELARRLVPWEQMGFARYDPKRREMEVLVDTGAGRAAGRGGVGAGRPVRAEPDRHLGGDPRVEPGGRGLGTAGEHGGRARRRPRHHRGARSRRVQARRRPGHHRRRRDPRRRRADGGDRRARPHRDPDRLPPPLRARRHHRRKRRRGAPSARRGHPGREVFRDDRLHRQPDESAGPERHDRSRPGGRARAWLRGRRR